MRDTDESIKDEGTKTGIVTNREFVYLMPHQIPIILVFVDAETKQPIDYRQDNSDFAQALIYQIEQRRALKQSDAMQGNI